MKVLLLLISRRPSFAQFEEEQFWCRFFNGFAGPGEAFGHPALGYGEFWGGGPFIHRQFYAITKRFLDERWTRDVI